MPRPRFTAADVKAELRANGVEPAFDGYIGPGQPLPFLCSCSDRRPGTITFRALHYQGIRPLCPACRHSAQADRMRINRRAPAPMSASLSEAPGSAIRDATQHRVASAFAAHGARPLDAYVDQTTPIRFVCAGSCGGIVHTITWAALRTGRIPRCPACQADARPWGDTHPRYNPDRSDAERAQTRTAADRRWENAVRHAHNDTCLITRRHGTAAHHIYGYDTHPQLRLVLQNGVCLTHHLHREFHDIYGYGNNTHAQFVRFYEIRTGFICTIIDIIDLNPHGMLIVS